MRDSRVCEDCPRHGLSCAIRHRCYRGSLAQTLVVAAAYGLHRRLGTWRGVTMVALTGIRPPKLLEFNRQYPMFDMTAWWSSPNRSACRPARQPVGDRKNQMLFAGRLEGLKRGSAHRAGSLAAARCRPRAAGGRGWPPR